MALSDIGLAVCLLYGCRPIGFAKLVRSWNCTLMEESLFMGAASGNFGVGGQIWLEMTLRSLSRLSGLILGPIIA